MARFAEFSAARWLQCANNFAPLSLQQIKSMATVHEEIDNWLAADLYGELSAEEQRQLHTHLVDCAACREAHQETKTMNKILDETLPQGKPDSAFEQRMLAGFRNRVPERIGLLKLLAGLMRMRAAQVTAVAAVLLGLVLLGTMMTRESAAPLRARDRYANKESFEQPSQGAGTLQPARAEASDKSDELAAGKRIDVALAAPPDAAETRSSLEREFKAYPATVPPAGTTQAEMAARENANESVPISSAAEPSSAETPAPEVTNRKLIRNANVELEIVSFNDAVQKITAFATEERGYVATTNSQKQANGKLRGQVIVKVLPENLDRFLQKIRGLGELKNQTLGTEDVTKAYFDTDARLKNARVMEQRLIEMLKTKTGKVSDLLQVEKELGRVREDIEKMQGELKYWDSQVQFAKVTISLEEKDMEEPAAFLIKERSQLALYAPDVEKIYNDIKALASQKVQITNAQLNRDYSGRVSATIGMLIAPEESDAVIGKVKSFGRVENFQTQTERVAQGGIGMSESAKTKRDKVELNITISREEQEQAFQQTSLQIRTSSVDEKAKDLRTVAEKQGGRVRSSTFSRDPDGRELANVWLRVPMKNYPALMQSLDSLGKVENVTVQRQDRTGTQVDEANAPADISIQVYSQGNIVSHQSVPLATLRRTLAQSAAAIMWSVRMIGVAIAFLAPWVIAIVAIVWIAKRIRRARR
jgi:anti-sigma factor RsiW